MDTDFLLSKNNDWELVNGDVVLTSGASLIRQRWLQRIRTHKGEWLLDTDFGIDYQNDIYTKPNMVKIAAIFRKWTVETPGVLSVSSVEADWVDKSARTIKVTVEGTVEGPEDFVFYYTGSVATDISRCPDCFPKNFSGLVAWFDAQDFVNSTATLTDTLAENKAGTGVASGDCTILGVSTLNNKRAYIFDGVDQSLNIVDTPAIRRGTGDFTMFLVFKNTETADGVYGLIALDGITSAGVRERFVFYLEISSSATDLWVLSQRTGESAFLGSGSFSGFAGANIMSVVMSDSTIQTRINNAFFDLNIVSFFPKRELNGDITLGASLSDTGALGDYFKGAIGELLLYNRALSTEEVNSVTFCLGQKWAVPLSEEEAALGYGYFPYGISPYGL